MQQPSGTPRDFGVAFTALLGAAGLSVDQLANTLKKGPTPVGRSTLFDWRKGAHLPEDSDALLAVVRLCLRRARDRGADPGPAPDDEHGWRTLLAGARQTRDARSDPADPLDGLRAQVNQRAWVLVTDFEIYLEHLGGLQAQLDLIPAKMEIITRVIANGKADEFLARTGLGDARAPGLVEAGRLHEILLNLLMIAWQRGYLLARFHRFDRIPRPARPVDPLAVMDAIIAEGDPEHPDRSLAAGIEVVLQRAISLMTEPEPVTRTLRRVDDDLAGIVRPHLDSWCDTVRSAMGFGVLAAKAEFTIAAGEGLG